MPALVIISSPTLHPKARKVPKKCQAPFKSGARDSEQRNDEISQFSPNKLPNMSVSDGNATWKLG